MPELQVNIYSREQEIFFNLLVISGENLMRRGLYGKSMGTTCEHLCGARITCGRERVIRSWNQTSNCDLAVKTDLFLFAFGDSKLLQPVFKKGAFFIQFFRKSFKLVKKIVNRCLRDIYSL